MNKLNLCILCAACISVMFGCGRSDKKASSGVGPEDDRPPLLSVFPGLPEFPGSTLSGESEDRSRAVYTTASTPDDVRAFYLKELEKRNPGRIDEPFKNDKRRKCTRRWNMFDKPEGLYVIKGRRALLITPEDGKIVFERKEADRVWAAYAELSDEDFILTVRRFSVYMQKFKGKAEERDAYIEKGGLIFGASLERLKELAPSKLTVLIRYLQKHPDRKAEGIPVFLKELEFWEALEAVTSPECETPVSLSAQELDAFRKNWYHE